MNRRCDGNQCEDKRSCDTCNKNIRERRTEQEMSTERPLTTGHIPGDHQREQPDKAPLVNMPQGDVDNGHNLYHHAE